MLISDDARSLKYTSRAFSVFDPNGQADAIGRQKSGKRENRGSRAAPVPGAAHCAACVTEEQKMRPTIIATFLLAFFSLAASAADQGRVENQFFTIRDFALTNGTVMPEVKIGYETYGMLAPNGRNAVLITHGYTSTHHAAGRNPANGDNPGW